MLANNPTEELVVEVASIPPGSVEASSSSSVAKKTLSEHWRELAESRGFEWPGTEKDDRFANELCEAMDEPDGRAMIQKYHAMSQRHVASTGKIRLDLFLMLSIKENFMSAEQYYSAKEEIDKLFRRGEPSIAFFFMHLVTAESFERFQCKAINLDNAYASSSKADELGSPVTGETSTEENSTVKREENEEEESDGFVSDKAMVMAYGELETKIPDWIVALIVFAVKPGRVLDLNDSAKLHAITTMDTMFPGCTLADASMAMRGVDFMHMHGTIKEGDRFDPKLAHLSSRYSKMGVRESARLSITVVVPDSEKNVEPQLAFSRSFQTLLAYIICDKPPQIARSKVDAFDYTTRSELLLARKLRKFRREERKRMIKAGNLKKGESIAITVPERVFVHIQGVAKTNSNGERKYVPGEMYARLQSISAECAIAWLHCAMCGSESVLDWYWFMEAATVYSKFAENRTLFNKIEKSVKKVAADESKPSENGAADLTRSVSEN